MRIQAQGFTLIEVLVTVVIISFSLVSLAVMQIKTIQYGRSANYQSQATIMAHDMIERMRANPAGINNGDYHLPTATQNANCFTTTGCSTLAMAKNDMYEWADDGQYSASKNLPLGLARVCIDSTPDDGVITNGTLKPECDNTGEVYAVKIWWHGVDSTTQRLVTTVAF